MFDLLLTDLVPFLLPSINHRDSYMEKIIPLNFGALLGNIQKETSAMRLLTYKILRVHAMD